MAKASRVAARTARKMVSMEERLQRIEFMLEVLMTKKQRDQFEALLIEGATGVPGRAPLTLTMTTSEDNVSATPKEGADVESESA